MFLTNLCAEVALAARKVALLTADLDYLKTGGNGAFDKLSNVVKAYFADAYQFLIVVGVALLVLAAVIAGILFGIMKDSAKVKENKSWLIRILAAVAIVALALTLVSIAFGIGEAADNSVNDTAFREPPYGIMMEC